MYTHIQGASLDFRNRVIHQALHDAGCHPKEKEKAFSFVRHLQNTTQASTHSSFVIASPLIQTKTWTFILLLLTSCYRKLQQTATPDKREAHNRTFLLAPELCCQYLSGCGHLCKQSTSTREGEQGERWLLDWKLLCRKRIPRQGD